MGFLEDLAPKKIMLAGDWHGQNYAAKDALLLAKKENVDLIIQLGDFGLWSGFKGDQYLKYVTLKAAELDIKVLWLDGNHEDFTKLYAKPLDPYTALRHYSDYLIHLPRNTRWQWSGINFHALGGGTSLDRSNRTEGINWWPQEAITQAQAYQAINLGQTDILLLHDCPEGVTIPTIDRLSSLKYWPEPALRDAWAHRELLQEICKTLLPKKIYHGHFHLNYTATASFADDHDTLVTGLAHEALGVKPNTLILDLAQLALNIN